MPYLQLNNQTAEWGKIRGEISNQKDLQNKFAEYAPKQHSHPEYSPISSEFIEEIEEHLQSIANPHQVSRGQVGLSNLTNDAQLRRRASDFMEFDEKSIVNDNDILLIEDSADNHNKKKIKASALKEYILKG